MEKTEHLNRAANERFAPLGVMSASPQRRSFAPLLLVAEEPWKPSWVVKVGGALLLDPPSGARESETCGAAVERGMG